jgi:carboxymethylenebutenolidase
MSNALLVSNALLAETITVTTGNGDEIQAYSARALGESRRGGVVVIHHLPGYDDPTKEIARRLAHHGYNAVVPNLFWRQAPGARPDDAAATARAKGDITDEQFLDDVAGAVSYLKSLGNSNGKVATIGYCSGGRQSFRAAVTLDLSAAVDCYGAFVTGAVPEGSPIKVTTLAEKTPNLSCLLLGLFGAEDKYPSPADVAELEEALKAAGKAHEFHTHPGAGHGFFSVNRPACNVEAANDGWERILAFFGRYL